MDLHAEADRLGIPPRTVDDVRKCLTKAALRGVDTAMANLMLAHGRLTDEARAFVQGWVK